MVKKSVVLTAFLLFGLGGVFQNFSLTTLRVCEASEQGTACSENKLRPIDEGQADTSFKTFRERLMEAVKETDVGFITDILAPDIINSYTEKKETGRQHFLEKWKPESACSKLWGTLKAVLSMGGSFKDKNRKEFEAPYVYSSWSGDYKPSEYSAVIGKEINVREKPDLNAPVITRLSHDLVKVNYDGKEKNGEWKAITTPDGKKGYVLARFLRNKYDYGIRFVKENGKWKIKFFAEIPEDKRILPPPE